MAPSRLVGTLTTQILSYGSQHWQTFLSRSGTLFDSLLCSVNTSSFIASICFLDLLTLQVAAFSFSRAGLAEAEMADQMHKLCCGELALGGR